mgnify:CR=1 FL=1
MADSELPLSDAFARDVIAGLRGRPKAIPSRWLYDQTGSELFEDITGLPEYYLTRTETAILTEHARDMAAEIGPDAVLVEYGAGAAVKTRILLDALDRLAAYVPVDIADTFLQATARGVQADYPGLDVVPIVADFMSADVLDGLPESGGRRVGFFPGSTVGNLTDAQIVDLLTHARRALGEEALFLMGADLKKDPGVLVPAYDDRQGVTAAFNLNLLTRINTELDGDFDLAAFSHEARWNAPDGRIEMHLVSLRDQTVHVLGEAFRFEAGESIHTEISRKFEPAALEALAGQAGWRTQRRWTDPDGYFSVILLQEAGAALSP